MLKIVEMGERLGGCKMKLITKKGNNKLIEIFIQETGIKEIERNLIDL